MKITIAAAYICLLSNVLLAVGQPHIEPQRYADTLIHTHLSIPFSKEWADEFIEQVEAVKPDVIEFHATRIVDSDDQNLRRKLSNILFAKELSESLNFNLALTINLASSWNDREYNGNKKYVYRINPDGSRAGRWGRKHLCFNSPGIDEVIVPSYARIAEEVQPWQVWIDESVIGVNLCYCEHCKSRFKQCTGLEPPVKTEEESAYWDQWVTFHRHTYEQWMIKVHDAIKEVSPETIVTFNHAYFLEQPQAVPGHIVNLCADLLAEPLATGLYARYGAAADVPFDIMPGLGRDIWAGVKPKPIAQIKEDIAVITANGGRWNIGEFPTNRTTLRSDWKEKNITRPADEYLRLAQEGAEYARARQVWTHKTQPIAYGAVLHSATTHYSKVIPEYSHINESHNNVVLTSDGTTVADNKSNEAKTRIYWPGNRYVAEEVVGAYEALLENQIQFHIINEDTLNRDWNDYQFLVIPGQFRLSTDTAKSIEQFVNNGGVVVVSGTTLESGILEQLGLPGTVKHHDPASFSHRGERFEFDQYYEFSPEYGEALNTFDNHDQAPAVVRYQVGRGQVVCIGVRFFDLYQRLSLYGHTSKAGLKGDAARNYVEEIFEILLPDRPFRVKAPDYYEVTINTKDGSTLINLVDRSLNWEGRKQVGGDIEIVINTPSKPSGVWLRPNNEALVWQWEDGLVKTTVPLDKIDVFSIVEIQ